MKYPIIPAVFALIGAAFCAMSATGGADALCVTQGCSLTKDVTVLGVSLWWWGTAGFAGLCALVFVNATLAFGLGLVALAVDCFFLAWLALTMPCFNCLVGGTLFCLVFVGLYPMWRKARIPALAVVGLWLLLLSPNVFTTFTEVVGQPWPIYGKADASIRIFFSPSCPACVDAVKQSLDGGAKNTAFFPVAKNDEDAAKLYALAHKMENQELTKELFTSVIHSELTKSATSPDMDFTIKLLRNKMAVARMGSNTIPLILITGLPEGGVPGSKQDLKSSGTSLSGQNGFRGCVEGENGEEADCD